MKSPLPLKVVLVLLLSVGFLSACAPGFIEGFNNAYYGPGYVAQPSSAFEGRITSSFTGFKHGNVYVLANGQVWEQTEYYYWYWYAYSPRVLIYPSYGSSKMLVEGIDHPVTVRRIR
jgi:hypothetical protein